MGTTQIFTEQTISGSGETAWFKPVASPPSGASYADARFRLEPSGFAGLESVDVTIEAAYDFRGAGAHSILEAARCLL